MISADAQKLVAIALQYDSQSDAAPKITAKGTGFLASQILEIAKKNDIKIESNEELAQILALCEVNEYIPAPAFLAVAQILSAIQKFKRSA